MGKPRGSYRHKASESTGDARREPERSAILHPRHLAELDAALSRFLGLAPSRPRPSKPRPAAARWIKWTSTYQGPCLRVNMIAAAASRAIEAGITAGTITKPDGAEVWRDPWEGFGE